MITLHCSILSIFDFINWLPDEELILFLQPPPHPLILAIYFISTIFINGVIMIT